MLMINQQHGTKQHHSLDIASTVTEWSFGVGMGVREGVREGNLGRCLTET